MFFFDVVTLKCLQGRKKGSLLNPPSLLHYSFCWSIMHVLKLKQFFFIRTNPLTQCVLQFLINSVL